MPYSTKVLSVLPELMLNSDLRSAEMTTYSQSCLSYSLLLLVFVQESSIKIQMLMLGSSRLSEVKKFPTAAFVAPKSPL